MRRQKAAGFFGRTTGEPSGERLAGFSIDTPILKILVEPSDPDCVYALFSSESGTLLTVSENGGLSWTLRAIKGLADIFLSPHRRGVLFATGETDDGARFHRSFDGGATWDDRRSCLPDPWAGRWGSPRISSIRVCSTRSFREGDAVVLDLMKSEDTGSTWTRVRGDADRLVHLLALDPASRTTDGRRNSRIYIAGEGGLFRSENEGRTMTRVYENGINSLVVDPVRTDHVFISVDSHDNWVSASYDRGASWTRGEHEQPVIGDLRWVTSLSLDPVGRILYAGTRGGGIYANDWVADPLFSRLNFRASVELNRSLALREYIHVLTWADDSRNPLLAAYQVMVWDYDPEHPDTGENYVLAAEVPASTKQVIRRAMNPKHRYFYCLRGIDQEGRTTPWASAAIAPVN